MKGMARCLGAGVRGLVDEHSVHGTDIGTDEAFHVIKHLQRQMIYKKHLRCELL